MIAVILAAGKGTRMGDLSREIPKPMLQVAGKPILFHILDALPDEVSEVLITVNYLKEKIIDALGPVYSGKKITYVENKRLLGTADALWDCKDYLQNENKFIVMMGDNLYAKEDLEKCVARPWSMLVEKRDSIKGVAKVVLDDQMYVEDIIERYPNEEGGYTSPGVYVLTPDIFKYEMKQWGNGEYGLPQTIITAKNEHKIKGVPVSFVKILTTPDDIRSAEAYFQSTRLPTPAGEANGGQVE